MPSRPRTFRGGGGPSSDPTHAYDRERGSARARGYTKQWDHAARHFRSLHPLCVGCSAIGRTEAATLVDHIIPHRGDQRLFWDQGNWQSACAWHGNAIKQELERLYDRGVLAVEQLRLDSPKAIEFSKRDREDPGGG